MDAELEHFCVLVWAISKELFLRKHDISLMHTPIHVNCLNSFIQEFNIARRELLVPLPCPVERSCAKWVKLVGHVRLDVDAGFDDRNGSYSIGALVCNHDGDILVAQVANIGGLEQFLGVNFRHYLSVCVYVRCSLFIMLMFTQILR